MRNPLSKYQQQAPKGAETEQDAIVRQHAQLVYRIVRQVAERLPPSVDREDLFGAGMVGLLEAIQKFEPDRGIVFEAYARIRIRGAVLDALRRLDHLSRRMRRQTKSVRDTHQKMEQEAGAPVGDAEVAETTGLTIEEVQESRMRRSAPESVDPQVLDSIQTPTLWQGMSSTLETLEREEAITMVANALADLPERNRLIMGLYYEAELTLKEIGQVVGVTESRVSQIMRKTVAIIRVKIEAQKD